MPRESILTLPPDSDRNERDLRKPCPICQARNLRVHFDSNTRSFRPKRKNTSRSAGVKSVKVRGSGEGDIFVSERCELQAGCKNLSNYD